MRAQIGSSSGLAGHEAILACRPLQGLTPMCLYVRMELLRAWAASSGGWASDGGVDRLLVPVAQRINSDAVCGCCVTGNAPEPSTGGRYQAGDQGDNRQSEFAPVGPPTRSRSTPRRPVTWESLEGPSPPTCSRSTLRSVDVSLTSSVVPIRRYRTVNRVPDRAQPGRPARCVRAARADLVVR